MTKRVAYATPEEAFAARTEWRGECLVWTGYVGPKGYGTLRVDGRPMLAHRYAWTRVYGPIAEGVLLDHSVCFNRACVNVDHLREADYSQNGQNRQGAQANSKTGVRNVTQLGDRFQVGINAKGRRIYCGSYPTVEEAAQVAEAKRQELFGVYAGRG